MSSIEKESPADAGTSNGAIGILKTEKPYIWGSAFATLGLQDALHLKPNGWYHVEPEDDWIKITIHRPDCPPEIVMYYTEGHANQYRLQLSDEGMAGLIEGAL